MNQIHLIIQLHQHRYPNDRTQVGLIGTLFSSAILTWFIPFLEHQYPLLNNFETFLKEFDASCGDSNKECTTSNHLQALCQGSCLTSMYAYEFRQLACDISWDEVTL
jgi:hypothetical protein